VTALAARALGLREGPIHAELRVREGNVSVLELAARSIGGLCSRALRFGAGVSLEQLILRHALGLSLEELPREPGAAGVMMIPIPCGGTLAQVDGQEQARAVPGVGGLEITIACGRPGRSLAGGRSLPGLRVRARAHPRDGGALPAPSSPLPGYPHRAVARVDRPRRRSTSVRRACAPC
jgi:hypothetical protein